MRVIVAAMLVSSFATSAAANDPSPTPEKPARERLICHNQEVISSHIPLRECHTASEWQQIAEQNKQRANEFADDRRQNGVQPKGGLGGGS